MDSSYCHSSYWLPHVIIDMPTFQIHFMFVPHACGLLGVLNMLYSQCCGMAIWKFDDKCWWNGALHFGHLLLTTIKVIRHCRWDMCWQVLKIYSPSTLNGEQQIRHSSHFAWRFEVWATKIPLFFLTRQWYIPNRVQDVSPNLCLFSYIFGKLLENIVNILGHDVKLCDWNLPSSWYSTYIFTSSTPISIARDVTKIHARCMWFEFCWLAFINTSTSFQYCSFMLINIWW